MKNRCLREENAKNYSDRGITVCERWLESFENFFEDMGKVPCKGAQLDRIDNDKGYSKDNCRWVTRNQNGLNKRGSIKTSKYKGVSWNKPHGEWEAKINLDKKRYYLGYFTNEDDAGRAYNEKAKELFGEYAYLNKIEADEKENTNG